MIITPFKWNCMGRKRREKLDEKSTKLIEQRATSRKAALAKAADAVTRLNIELSRAMKHD